MTTQRANHAYRIDIADDLMTVLDAKNNGHDCHVLAKRAEAIRKLDTWASWYPFDLDAAVALLDEVFAER